MATIDDKLSSDEGMKETEKKYWVRVQERTGLTLQEARFYDTFTHNSDFDDGVIMFDDTRHDIAGLLGLFNGEWDSEKQEIAEAEYQKWLKFFKDRGLIHQEERIFGETSYPVLSGYNPFNDSEMYIPCRKKGEDRWGGRILIETFIERREEMTAKGYEFRV